MSRGKEKKRNEGKYPREGDEVPRWRLFCKNIK